MPTKLYRCDVCSKFIDESLKLVKEHEKIPVNEGSIDGLMIIGFSGYHNIFRKSNFVTREHDRLYHIDLLLPRVNNGKISPETLELFDDEDKNKLTEQQAMDFIIQEMNKNHMFLYGERNFRESYEFLLSYNPDYPLKSFQYLIPQKYVPLFKEKVRPEYLYGTEPKEDVTPLQWLGLRERDPKPTLNDKFQFRKYPY